MLVQDAKTKILFNNKEYDLAVVIGRFQLKHIGHAMLFNKAMTVANNVLVLVGSAGLPRSIKNPFTFEDNYELIIDHFKTSDIHIGSFDIKPLQDNLYSDTSWAGQVQSLIEDRVKGLKWSGWSDAGMEKNIRVCIVGNKKDESSYYLNLFPQYNFVPVDEFKLSINATDLRTILFEAPEKLQILGDVIPPKVREFLANFIKTPEYAQLVEEYEYIKAYKESWSLAPYAPTFITVDAVVVKAGHVLMVQRKESPGKGLWALPGGFLNPRERIIDGAVRELYEETNIDLPPGLLRGSLTKVETFDHPDRSLRGRTITFGHLFSLDGNDKKPGLPKVKAADDAADTKWVPINKLINSSDQIFEDHGQITKNLLGL